MSVSRLMQIDKIKANYPAFKDVDESEFLQVFDDCWPEFIMVGDDDWYRYEFIDGEFVRGSSPDFDSGINQMGTYMHNVIDPALALRSAYEGEYLGFVIQYGVHPADCDIPTNGDGTYSLGVNEGIGLGDERRLTRMCNGRHPDDSKWEKE